MNDNELSAKINWKRIKKGLPKRPSFSANDRAYSLEELRLLVNDYPDRRLKPIVYVMRSSGIRLSAWKRLRWKDVTRIPEDESLPIKAAKLIVFDEKTDTEYYTFITPEAYNALETYRKYRSDSGEVINGESPLLRDKFQTPNNPEEYTAIRALIKNPKPLGIEGIKRIMYRALVAQNLRYPLAEGETRHEVKMFHGLRKFFETCANLAGMNPLVVEKLQGHLVGLNPSYFKPTEQEVLDDYLKAVSELTINDIDNATLEKQVAELEKKAQDAEAKASKVDPEEIAKLRAQVATLEGKWNAMSEERTLIGTLMQWYGPDYAIKFIENLEKFGKRTPAKHQIS